MKAHIGVDMASGLVHTVTTTPANTADVTQVERLLHGKEKSVGGDAGYTGANKRDGLAQRRLAWHIASKPGKLKAMPSGELKDATRYVEYLKAAVRAKVEHPFRVIKRQFGYTKVRYRGLVKNTGQVLTLFALSNVWMARRRLLAMA
jgi:IS5 family transposase